MADIEFNCPKCGNRLTVDEQGIGMTVACPECKTPITIPNPRKPPPIRSSLEPANRKPVSSVWTFAVAITALAVALAAVCLVLRVKATAVILPNQVCYDDPALMIRKMYEDSYRHPTYVAEQYFKYRNRSEILKTLEIVEVPTNADLAVAFVRFSVGTRVFRDTHWMRKVDGKYWLLIPYLSKYAADKSKDPALKQKADWIEGMEKRKEEWAEGSATPY